MDFIDFFFLKIFRVIFFFLVWLFLIICVVCRKFGGEIEYCFLERLRDFLLVDLFSFVFLNWNFFCKDIGMVNLFKLKYFDWLVFEEILLFFCSVFLFFWVNLDSFDDVVLVVWIFFFFFGCRFILFLFLFNVLWDVVKIFLDFKFGFSVWWILDRILIFRWESVELDIWFFDIGVFVFLLGIEL